LRPYRDELKPGGRLVGGARFSPGGRGRRGRAPFGAPRRRDQFDDIARELNTRAWRTLGYATPAEALNDYLVATTT